MRTGKIARCPQGVRDRLNIRLQNGEQGETLLEWLNGLPQVKQMLGDSFSGVPISKQNLSEWRQGGYEEWLEHQKTCDFIQNLAEQGGDFDDAGLGMEVSDWLAARLAVDLAQVALKMLAETTEPKERWHKLQEILPQLAELRRHDHRAARLRHDQAMWDREEEQHAETERANSIREMKRKILAPFWARLKRQRVAGIFGGGKKGEWIADFFNAVEEDLPEPTIEDFHAACEADARHAEPGHANSNPGDASRSQSNPVKPENDPVITS